MDRWLKFFGFALGICLLASPTLAEVAVSVDPDADGILGVATPSPEGVFSTSNGSGPNIAAQDMLAVSWSGNAYKLDSSTGTGSLLGPTGTSSLNAMAGDGAGTFYSAGRGNILWKIDPTTGVASAGPGISIDDIRALAMSAQGVLYGVEDLGHGQIDRLHTINVNTGATVLIGSMGVPGIQGMAFAPGGTLYAWDLGTSQNGMGLARVNTNTGAVTDVNPNVGCRDLQTLAFAPSGVCYGARMELYTINTNTGQWTLVGSGGYSDVRGSDFLDGGINCNLIKKFKNKCKNGKLKAKVKSGLPGGTVLHIDNSVNQKTVVLNNKGNGKAKWTGQSGQRRMSIVECPNRACTLSCPGPDKCSG